MNTQEQKEKLQKYTIGYLIAMVVIFVIVLIGVRSPALKTVALIVTVVVFSALIFLQWKKANAARTEETSSFPTEKVSSAPEVKEAPKAEMKHAPVSKEPTKAEEKPGAKPTAKEPPKAEAKPDPKTSAKKPAAKAKAPAKKPKAKTTTTSTKKAPAKKAPPKE